MRNLQHNIESSKSFSSIVTSFLEEWKVSEACVDWKQWIMSKYVRTTMRPPVLEDGDWEPSTHNNIQGNSFPPSLHNGHSQLASCARFTFEHSFAPGSKYQSKIFNSRSDNYDFGTNICHLRGTIGIDTIGIYAGTGVCFGHSFRECLPPSPAIIESTPSGYSRWMRSSTAGSSDEIWITLSFSHLDESWK